MKILLATALDAMDFREEKSVSAELTDLLQKKGHQVDSIYLPYSRDLRAVPEQLLAYRLMTIDPSVDMLFAIGYPAFALRHPRKTALLFELTPQFHEQWDSEYGIPVLPNNESENRNLRETVLRAEKRCLEECEAIYCGSEFFRTRIQADCMLSASSFVYAAQPREGNEALTGDYIVCETCLDVRDRVDLLLDAVSKDASIPALHLYIPQADLMYIRAIQMRVERLMLKDCVFLHDGYIPFRVLEACKAAICLGRYATRIPSYMIQAANQGVYCIYAQDNPSLKILHTCGKNVVAAIPDSANLAELLENYRAHPKTAAASLIENTIPQIIQERVS